jgi:tetrahydromethanopterin S-methyltransferase subunit A
MATTESTDTNNWPVTDGDYVIGEPDSPVAVVTLASDYRNMDSINDYYEDDKL